MHIVLANQWYPPESGWGGIAAYNHAMAHALKRLGHRVTVVASRHSRDIAPQSDVDGIRIHRLLLEDNYRLRLIPIFGRHVRGLGQLEYGRRVNQTLSKIDREEKIDVIEFAEANAEGIFFARSPFCPFVVRCHTPAFLLAQDSNQLGLPYNTRLTGSLEKRFIRQARLITAPSSDLATVIANQCQIKLDRITVIPNGLDTDTFKDTIRSDQKKEITILHVGRIERAKGVDILVEAIPQIIRQVPQARFVFVGSDSRTSNGTKRMELEVRLRDFNCSSYVRFIGYVAQEELIEWYAQADLCVVPTIQYESFSYTCAQAMAAGRPVVASRIGGIPETVKDGETGIVVAPNDSKALAEAIVLLAKDRSLRSRMATAGRERAVCKFDSRLVAQQNINIYLQAIAFHGQELEG